MTMLHNRGGEESSINYLQILFTEISLTRWRWRMQQWFDDESTFNIVLLHMSLLSCVSSGIQRAQWDEVFTHWHHVYNIKSTSIE